MFERLSIVAKDLRMEMLEVYWVLLGPLVLILIVMDILRGAKAPLDVSDIFRRVIVSLILLFTFDYTINTIGMIGDGITEKVGSLQSLSEAIKSLGPNSNGNASFFDLRGHVLYAFSLLSYVVAYLGFFVAEALTQFVWVVLFTLSPLMILAYIPRATANVTVNLYKGLVKVVIWKTLWTLLGVLLLRLAMNPQFQNMEDYLLSVTTNLCIGLSMLFIPFATRSLINDGLESAATALASAPTMAAAGAAKAYTTKLLKQGAHRAWGGGRFAMRPLTNPITGRLARLRASLKPRVQKFKKEYGNMNSPGQKYRSQMERFNKTYGLSREPLAKQKNRD